MKKPEPKEYKVLKLLDVILYFKSKGFEYSQKVIDVYFEHGNGSYFYTDEFDNISVNTEDYDISICEFAKMFIEEYGSGYNYIITVDW